MVPRVCLSSTELLKTHRGTISTPLFQVELDHDKGLEMRRWVLSGILTSEKTYLSQLEALLIVSVS